MLRPDSPPKCVCVVHDDPHTLRRLDRVISQDPGFIVSSKCPSLSAALNEIKKHEPDVLLTDIRLPDGDGTELIRYVSANVPSVRVMVLSAVGDEPTVLNAIEAGASGYLLKDEEPLNILESLRSLLAGGAPVSASVASFILKRIQIGGRREGVQLLTRREREVLACIARGLSYRETADELGLSPQTVPGHIKAIYRKLKVTSKSSAVYEALRRKIIDV